MNKICIIGNSHMGALKRVYNNQERQEIDLYASGNKKLSSLYLQDTKLLTDDLETKNDLKRTKGNDYIELDPYNHVLIYGCGILSPGFVEYYASSLSQRYSNNCLVEAATDRLNFTFGFKIAKMIKDSKLCEKVTIIPSPLLSEVFQLYNEKRLSLSTPDLARQTLDKVELIYKNYLEQSGISLLCNPRKLLSKNGFTTDIKYKGTREGDVTHMNDEGAKIVLDNILSYLGI